MGFLNDRIKMNSGGDIPGYYKANTFAFYERYQTPKDGVKSIPISDIQEGKFYFIMYEDESNWMKFSPIFLVDYKKFDSEIILYAMNFNFIPLEIRSGFFDRYIKNIEEDPSFLNITFEATYKELFRVGYEYSLMEFNSKRLKRIYEIPIGLLPEFLYSGWPANKYDPKKLHDIWKKKIETKEARHIAMMKINADEYFKAFDDMEKDFGQLNEHIKRLQRNEKKFGSGN